MTGRLADLAILTPRIPPTLVVPRPNADPNLSHTDRNQPLQDPAFKMVFCHPVAIERLVRTYASEYADRIDFSTLEKLDAELVGEALVRRYPDMLWMARPTWGPGRVIIQLEFQGARDRLMALRMAVYQSATAIPEVGSGQLPRCLPGRGRIRWRLGADHSEAGAGSLCRRYTGGSGGADEDR